MKTLFLGVIFSIILFVSGCQKEELEPVLEKSVQQESTTWKTNDWVLIKKGVMLNGTKSDLYENTKTGQQVYEAIDLNSNKALSPTGTFKYVEVSTTTHVICDGKPKDCWAGTIDGQRVIVYILPEK